MFIDSYSLSCGLGETVNSACSECIVISICLQDNPCENGEKCVHDPAVSFSINVTVVGRIYWKELY